MISYAKKMVIELRKNAYVIIVNSAAANLTSYDPGE